MDFPDKFFMVFVLYVPRVCWGVRGFLVLKFHFVFTSFVFFMLRKFPQFDWKFPLRLFGIVLRFPLVLPLMLPLFRIGRMGLFQVGYLLVLRRYSICSSPLTSIVVLFCCICSIWLLVGVPLVIGW